MSDPCEIIDLGEFGEARELPIVLRELLDAGRRAGGLGRYDIVYVVGPDGQVFHRAPLVRSRLTDGSPTFTIVLS